MPTLAERMRRIAGKKRAIPGQKGLRPFRVYVSTKSWAGVHVGEGASSTDEVEILENGQPPKVKSVDDRFVQTGRFSVGTLQIGPITPTHAGGGTALSVLIPATGTNERRYYRIVGPGTAENGDEYRYADADADKALHYTIFVSDATASEY